MVRIRAPSDSMGNLSLACGSSRRNVTIRLAFGLTPNFLYGSETSSCRNASMGRMMVRKAWPRRSNIAASALRCSPTSAALRALNTTLPLDNTVFTSVKPANSKTCLRSAIFAFIGMTPLRNAA